jgi:hypothetical protein
MQCRKHTREPRAKGKPLPRGHHKAESTLTLNRIFEGFTTAELILVRFLIFVL